MLIFLHGADSYRLKIKIDEIIVEYQKKYSSGLNLAKIDMEESDISALREQSDVVSMFSEKKLVILSNVFGNTQKEETLLNYFIDKKLAKDKDIILIIKSVEADTRGTKRKVKKEEQSGLREFLLSNSKCQEFKLLSIPQLRRWIVQALKKEGIKIGEKALAKLIDFVGDDLWQIDKELEKLVSYKSYPSTSLRTSKSGRMINETDVEKLVKPKVNLDIFATIDNLARKNRGDTLGLLKKHLGEGENALYLLSMFVYQFRNIIKIKDFLERGFQEKEIASEIKMHPYVLQKSMAQAKIFSFQDLKKIYRMFFQADLSIKTGRIKPETALDLLVMEITK